MVKKATIAVTVFLLVAVVAAVLEPTQAIVGHLMGEPFFDGRPARYWDKGLQSDPGIQSEAREALAGDSGSVAVLVHLLRSSDSSEVRWMAAELLGELGPTDSSVGPVLLRALDDADPHVQAVAIASIAAVDVPAKDAVPALTPLVLSVHSIAASRSLSVYKGEAVDALPELLQVLRDEQRDVEVRWNAARTIGKIGPAAVETVPELMEFVTHDEATIREHAAEALGDIGPLAAESVPVLIEALKDPATRVRRDAVRSLGYFGDKAHAALSDARRLLDDPEELVRNAAKEAVKRIVGEEGNDVPPPSG